ncbi:MAG TPA: glycosyltransferase family 2 protein [Polyangia bacterium]|jgi:Glycosyltransferases involved in cell wall biogenesis|nr:glycosyltransferase family 2 protein [Polyangia bacterium]
MTSRPISISIVIPAYNEEAGLEPSLNSALSALHSRGIDSYEVILVNDASTDRTGDVVDRLAAANSRIRAIHHSRNMGMGRSLLSGFEVATKDYIGSFPADSGLDWKGFAEMLDLVGQYDVVSYYIANPEFRTWHRRSISWSFVALLNMLFGFRLRYYNGHAIYRRDQLRDIPHTTFGHAFLAETLVRLLQNGSTFIEIGTIQFERVHGKTKAFRVKNVIGVGLALLRHGVSRLSGPLRSSFTRPAANSPSTASSPASSPAPPAP